MLITATTSAYELNDVKVIKVVSQNPAGHMWVEVSGGQSDCPGSQSSYFIIKDWDQSSEPGATQRQVMLTLVMTAFAAGKDVRVTGASCYLDQYLFADSIQIVN